MVYKTVTTMTIEEVKTIIDEKMEKDFDSHDFIKEFIWQNPEIYGKMLMDYKNVTIAHSQISLFLLNHAETLKIKKVDEKVSDDIFGHPTPCAQWKKLS